MNERIKFIRKSLKLDQTAFGLKINISRSQVSNLESGSRTITDRIIADICREYGVNEEWLRTGKGSMTAPLPDVSEELLYITQKYNLEEEELKVINAWYLLPSESRNKTLIFINQLADFISKREGGTV